MIALLAAWATAAWLGIMTSISPCTMATNIAAVSFIGRRIRPASVLWTGMLYAAGRALTYIALGVILAKCLLSASALSYSIQRIMNLLLGPLLILIGMVLLDLLRFKMPDRGLSGAFQQRAERWGSWGALPLGALFALSFCPISAALFFGSLMTLALKTNTYIGAPLWFGVGTAVPALGAAFIIAFAGASLGRAFQRMTAFEKYARIVTGVIFICIGVYYCLRYIFRVF